MKQDLINKLTDKIAVIGIMGLDYVGIPYANRYADVGCIVVGYDIDLENAEKIWKARECGINTRFIELHENVASKVIYPGFKQV